MAVLNSWQKISRVLAQDGGDGADGSATVSSSPNIRATYSGTASSTAGTAGSTSFANGDLVLLHQTQGTGVGQWEINRVASGGGTTSLTMQEANHYTYGTGAQIIKIPRYTTATINSHTVTAWNGTVGGIEVICAKTSITVASSNTHTLAGVQPSNTYMNPGTSAGGVGGGFAGGAFRGYNAPTTGYRGAGTASAGGDQSTAANGNGGGAGQTTSDPNGSPGGGGGNGAAGTSGTSGNPTGGTGGSAVGSVDLITMCMGGGGGGGCKTYGVTAGGGGSGGGIAIYISKSVTISGATNLNGGAGGTGSGGGAGGSCLIVCETAALGTNLITATGGGVTNLGGAGSAGAGAVGRIAVHHSGTVTGTTNPTFNDTSDTFIETTAPTVTTSALTILTANTASCGGDATADGGASITAKGICWNTTGTPTTSDTTTNDGTGTGSFSSSLTSLPGGTTIYVRAYATNSVGTSYGSQVSTATTSSTVNYLKYYRRNRFPGSITGV